MLKGTHANFMHQIAEESLDMRRGKTSASVLVHNNIPSWFMLFLLLSKAQAS